jgi:hypothetical protein
MLEYGVALCVLISSAVMVKCASVWSHTEWLSMMPLCYDAVVEQLQQGLQAASYNA